MSPQVTINRETPVVDATPSNASVVDASWNSPAETTLILGDETDPSSSSLSAGAFSELLFPTTAVGVASEALLVLKNGRRTSLRWRLSSFAPPYVRTDGQGAQKHRQKAANGQKDIFGVAISSGVLSPEGETKVFNTFLFHILLVRVLASVSERMSVRRSVTHVLKSCLSAVFDRNLDK